MHITTGMIPKTSQYSIKHFNSLHIPNSQPYFWLPQNNNFFFIQLPSKIEWNSKFYKIPFFFLQQDKKFIVQWVFSLFLTKYHSKHCSRPSFVLKPKHENVPKETTQIMIFFYLKVDDNPSTRPTIYRLNFFSQK